MEADHDKNEGTLISSIINNTQIVHSYYKTVKMLLVVTDNNKNIQN